MNTFKGSNKFGVSEINLPEGNLHLLREHITSMYITDRLLEAGDASLTKVPEQSRRTV